MRKFKHRATARYFSGEGLLVCRCGETARTTGLGQDTEGHCSLRTTRRGDPNADFQAGSLDLAAIRCKRHN